MFFILHLELSSNYCLNHTVSKQLLGDFIQIKYSNKNKCKYCKARNYWAKILCVD